ncbi:hypothetical protein V6N13_041161 [Hibiscus sabdariffa]
MSCSWTPPLQDALKFNTDGVVIDNFSEAGIGGCLRNDRAKCFIFFSRKRQFNSCPMVEMENSVLSRRLAFRQFAFLVGGCSKLALSGVEVVE